jgi:hypothetical protein
MRVNHDITGWLVAPRIVTLYYDNLIWVKLIRNSSPSGGELFFFLNLLPYTSHGQVMGCGIVHGCGCGDFAPSGREVTDNP